LHSQPKFGKWDKMAGVFDIELSTAGAPINAVIASMCRSARRVTIADRAALYTQGEPANTVFLILDGFVKTTRICEDGTEFTIELLKYGDIAGAIPTRQLPSEHEETAHAIGDVVVQRVLAHELRAAMEVNPRLAVFVTEYLARSKRSAERRVLRAMSQSVDRRVIETLVELAGSFGARCPHGFSLEIRLTQQDIADIVGASRPVVSSILSGLRKRGLLNYTRDMICVNDSALSLFARSLDTGPKGVSSI
jgi:CRP/FNR family transcriptional regulator, cyclic AMP receptor protein